MPSTPIKSVALWSGVVSTGFDGKAVVRLPAAAFIVNPTCIQMSLPMETAGPSSAGATDSAPGRLR